MVESPANIELRHIARVVDSSDDAIISKDLNGTIQSWNRAAERMFGYTAQEAIGRSIRMIIPADRQTEEDVVLARIRKGESVNHFETLRQRKDGTLVPISLTVSPIQDEGGTIIGASKIVRDLSDRKMADMIARRLAAVVESSDDAILTKSLDSTITSWNRAAEKMFGYTAEEAIGRSIRMIIPEDRQNEEDFVLGKIRNGEAVSHFETVRQRKDGTLVPISLTVSPVRDSDGVITGASKIARDTSERERLLALAQEQAAITAKLSHVGAEVASSLDLETIVERVANIAAELTHAEFGAFWYRVDSHSGPAYALYAWPRAQRAAPATLSHLRDTPRFALPFHGEGVVRLADLSQDPRHGENVSYFERPEGQQPVRAFLAVPVRAASGDLLGRLFLGHARAGVFTEQHEQLAAGVTAWGSLALENARLYLVAREADRLKDEFLAVLSHELRTPLNAILGYARLLRSGVLGGDKAVRGLETLERNATSLTQIVEDVLDVSRIVAGKIRLDVQPVELPLIIHNAVSTVQPAADAKGVRLQTIVDPHVGPVSGDPDRLQQVIWNLLSNAVKFTPRQGRVQIRLERVNSHVEVAVSDTGAGIPREFLSHVFERFRQAEAGMARSSGGLGLGLSIVRQIVEMHGGTVEAFSEGEGRGSTFRVQLPLMIVHPEPVSESREHPRSERLAPFSGLDDLSGFRVLAIDDEQDALGLLRAVLEAAGADVTTVPSAIAALERLEEIKPHVVVVDLGMPVMDGFEFIARLRAFPNADLRDVPAAALTAFARSEDRTRALRSGFEMHLAKPIDPGELVASVVTLVKRSRRGTST